VPPTEFDAVRTSPVSVLAEPELADVEGAPDPAAVAPVVLLEELLPHADSSTVARRVLVSIDALRMIAPI
jgi:hypothetical protein